jgi:glycosyltransferase involved in cell wall biosynthesis
LAGLAYRNDADAWHIHDFYMLPLALMWHFLARRPVIYDVHEYYGELYAARLPRGLQRMGRIAIERFQGWAAARLGGANVVAPEMSPLFRLSKTSVAITPNYPIIESYGVPEGQKASDRMRRVIHTGSLSESYGSSILVGIARALADQQSPIQLIVVARFASFRAKVEFDSLLAQAGHPSNLEVIPPVPVHDIPALLSTCGVGLSTLQDVGQNGRAVPTKLYEYTLMGLAILASDLQAQRTFVVQHAVGRLVPADSIQSYVNALETLVEDARNVSSAAKKAALQAQHTLNWEKACAPALRSLARGIIR